MVEEALQQDLDKMSKLRQLAAKKNRDIAYVERKIDEVPSRAELTQYQRQFVELFEQVLLFNNFKHKRLLQKRRK